MNIIVKKITYIFFIAILIASCNSKKEKEVDKERVNEKTFSKGTFGYDRSFLKKHYKNTIVLESANKESAIILSPELQGRVMTSSLKGNKGMSFGWINYDLIQSKEIKKHINATGGEERFWIGPEGGQFSIYFKPGVKFEFENWNVPVEIDTKPFQVSTQDKKSVIFKKEMNLLNYSGTKFHIEVTRKITLLTTDQISAYLKLPSSEFASVAYETNNTIKNIGQNDWNKETGLLSIWLLSMLNPSDEVTVIIPIKDGSEKDLGIKVNDNYFGKVGADRLQTTDHTVFYKGDGKSRGKIGVSPARATKFMGSYDAIQKVLTILEIPEPKSKDKYVKSSWELQKDPFSGDVLNSYNDGPLEAGSQIGPFYELESSSPALMLKAESDYTHTQRIYHFKGDKSALDTISKQILSVSIDEIEKVFKK